MITNDFSGLFDAFKTPVIAVLGNNPVYFNLAAEICFSGLPFPFDLPDNGCITLNGTEYNITCGNAFDHKVYFLTPTNHFEESNRILYHISSRLKSKISELKIAADKISSYTERYDDPKIMSSSNSISKLSAVLHRMVGNLGFFQSFDSLAFSPVSFDIAQTISDIVDSVPYFVGNTCPDMEFKCNVKNTIVQADKEKLELALYQLLSNSIKYTPSTGKVTVSLSDSGQNINITVSDTGCGIASEKLTEIWSVGNAGLSPSDGIGAGLPIVKHISRMHGGQTILTSNAKGTSVTISIPKTQPDADSLKSISAKYESGLSDMILQLSDVIPSDHFSNKYTD